MEQAVQEADGGAGNGISDRPDARIWAEIIVRESTGQLLASWIDRRSSGTCLPWPQASQPAQRSVTRSFALHDWCARADVPVVITLARTIKAWWPQILAFFDTGLPTQAPKRMPAHQ
jgi:hypothetical protein